MIFVATGTHHQPFDRLVAAADAVAHELGERLVVQRGPSRVPVRGEVHDVVDPARFEAWLLEARVVVLHAGSSSFLQARALGRRPIVVARRPEHGEHVDDHQVRFARALGADEAAVVDVEGLADAIKSHCEPSGPGSGAIRTQAFCDRFGPLVASLVRRDR